MFACLEISRILKRIESKKNTENCIAEIIVNNCQNFSWNPLPPNLLTDIKKKRHTSNTLRSSRSFFYQKKWANQNQVGCDFMSQTTKLFTVTN